MRIEALTSVCSIPIYANPLKLTREFYARPVLVVARECIGKVLVRRAPEGETAGRIVEVEAYRGPLDLAAHSSKGLTKRTAAMFGPPGHAYVYLLYGVSWALNLVTGAEGEPHAVLIRALEPLSGIELMARRRRRPAESRELTNGPGKLTQAMGITGADYGADLCGDTFFLQSDRTAGTSIRPQRANAPASEAKAKRVAIGTSRRINVAYAGLWALRPWRFYERGNRYVSVRPRD